MLNSKGIDAHRLRELMFIEQLKYCPDAPEGCIASELTYSTSHIPPQYVFNNQHKRLPNDPYKDVYLYTRPFTIEHEGKVYQSHYINGEFEILPRMPLEQETWDILLQCSYVSLAKCDIQLRQRCSFRWYEMEQEVILEIVRAFLEGNCQRTPSNIFNFLVTSGINAVRSIAQIEAQHTRVGQFDEHFTGIEKQS